MNSSLKKITYTSLLIAIVFIATVVIAIPSPLGGYVNLGDGAIYISAYFLSPVLGFLAAGLGSMLGDAYLGFIPYMIPTLIIKGTMGAVAAYMFKKKRFALGMLAGMAIMVFGYYGFEVFLYNNLISPLSGILYNSMQGVIGAIGGYITIKVFKKSGIKESLIIR
ncbi:MAG TPA: ECF transporter S component [Eubacteriaceae bacterium]|nr:ECF transporter S component [Eubacteriaceae bacterium]